MQQEHTQIEAYKRLLQMAQGILKMSSPQQSLLNKYYRLKAALLENLTPQQNPLTSTLHKQLLASYKYITASSLSLISEFEAQIQNSMEREGFSRKAIAVAKDWELKIQELRAGLGEKGGQKMRLIVKEELSALQYYCSELDSKFENMGLLIEVHKKMHEIIGRASEQEEEKARREQEMESNLRELQTEVMDVREGREFVEQYRVTEEKQREFKVWSRKLASVLFQK